MRSFFFRVMGSARDGVSSNGLDGTGIVVERGKVDGRCGGLTGSYAGLAGSSLSGPGVDGVDCGAHFVPNPRTNDDGVS